MSFNTSQPITTPILNTEFSIPTLQIEALDQLATQFPQMPVQDTKLALSNMISDISCSTNRNLIETQVKMAARALLMKLRGMHDYGKNADEIYQAGVKGLQEIQLSSLKFKNKFNTYQHASAQQEQRFAHFPTLIQNSTNRLSAVTLPEITTTSSTSLLTNAISPYAPTSNSNINVLEFVQRRVHFLSEQNLAAETQPLLHSSYLQERHNSPVDRPMPSIRELRAQNPFHFNQRQDGVMMTMGTAAAVSLVPKAVMAVVTPCLNATSITAGAISRNIGVLQFREAIAEMEDPDIPDRFRFEDADKIVIESQQSIVHSCKKTAKKAASKTGVDRLIASHNRAKKNFAKKVERELGIPKKLSDAFYDDASHITMTLVPIPPILKMGRIPSFLLRNGSKSLQTGIFTAEEFAALNLRNLKVLNPEASASMPKLLPSASSNYPLAIRPTAPKGSGVKPTPPLLLIENHVTKRNPREAYDSFLKTAEQEFSQNSSTNPFIVTFSPKIREAIPDYTHLKIYREELWLECAKKMGIEPTNFEYFLNSDKKFVVKLDSTFVVKDYSASESTFAIQEALGSEFLRSLQLKRFHCSEINGIGRYFYEGEERVFIIKKYEEGTSLFNMMDKAKDRSLTSNERKARFRELKTAIYKLGEAAGELHTRGTEYQAYLSDLPGNVSDIIEDSFRKACFFSQINGIPSLNYKFLPYLKSLENKFKRKRELLGFGFGDIHPGQFIYSKKNSISFVDAERVLHSVGIGKRPQTLISKELAQFISCLNLGRPQGYSWEEIALLKSTFKKGYFKHFKEKISETSLEYFSYLCDLKLFEQMALQQDFSEMDVIVRALLFDLSKHINQRLVTATKRKKSSVAPAKAFSRNVTLKDLGYPSASQGTHTLNATMHLDGNILRVTFKKFEMPKDFSLSQASSSLKTLAIQNGAKVLQVQFRAQGPKFNAVVQKRYGKFLKHIKHYHGNDIKYTFEMRLKPLSKKAQPLIAGDIGLLPTGKSSFIIEPFHLVGSLSLAKQVLRVRIEYLELPKGEVFDPFAMMTRLKSIAKENKAATINFEIPHVKHTKPIRKVLEKRYGEHILVKKEALENPYLTTPITKGELKPYSLYKISVDGSNRPKIQTMARKISPEDVFTKTVVENAEGKVLAVQMFSEDSPIPKKSRKLISMQEAQNLLANIEYIKAEKWLPTHAMQGTMINACSPNAAGIKLKTVLPNLNKGKTTTLGFVQNIAKAFNVTAEELLSPPKGIISIEVKEFLFEVNRRGIGKATGYLAEIQPERIYEVVNQGIGKFTIEEITKLHTKLNIPMHILAPFASKEVNCGSLIKFNGNLPPKYLKELEEFKAEYTYGDSTVDIYKLYVMAKHLRYTTAEHRLLPEMIDFHVETYPKRQLLKKISQERLDEVVTQRSSDFTRKEIAELCEIGIPMHVLASFASRKVDCVGGFSYTMGQLTKRQQREFTKCRALLKDINVVIPFTKKELYRFYVGIKHLCAFSPKGEISKESIEGIVMDIKG